VYCTWNETNKILSVKDDGPGIAAEQVPLLFNRFYRADDSRSSHIPGSGLGLAIIKKLSDLLEIQISVNSISGSGTTITLQFPQ